MSPFKKREEHQLSPKVHITRGTGVKVRGIRGICSFLGIVTNKDGEEWADVYTYEKGGHRSVAVPRLLRRVKNWKKPNTNV